MRPFPRFVIVGASICLIGAIFLPRAATKMAFAQTAPAPQERVVPQSRADAVLSFAPVVKKAQPAVVNVFASRVDRTPANPFFDDPIFRRFFGENGGQPGRNIAQSLGSGVIVDSSGLVVTNNHVIEGMTDVKVSLADKREIPAKILLRDPRTDLAVLKLTEGGNFPVMELGDSDALEVGDLVLAIGNPFAVGQTVTQGIVSALARTQVGISDYGFFIQTDAAINPGNSGGPLVDMNGRMIGVNSAIFSKSGGSVGIGFAIPVNMVKIVVAAAKSGGKQVRRPWLGATLQTLSQEIAENSRAGASHRRVARRSRPQGAGGGSRPQARRRDRFGRRPDRRRSRGGRLPARDKAARRRGEPWRLARRQEDRRADEACRRARNPAA